MYCDRSAGEERVSDVVRQQQEEDKHDAWFRRQVQIGRDSADAGDLIPVV